MVSLINELVDRGVIERTVSRDDRRAFALVLSAAGRTLLADCLDRIRAHEDEMLADLTATERARLTLLLGKIEARER